MNSLDTSARTQWNFIEYFFFFFSFSTQTFQWFIKLEKEKENVEAKKVKLIFAQLIVCVCVCAIRSTFFNRQKRNLVIVKLERFEHRCAIVELYKRWKNRVKIIQKRINYICNLARSGRMYGVRKACICIVYLDMRKLLVNCVPCRTCSSRFHLPVLVSGSYLHCKRRSLWKHFFFLVFVCQAEISLRQNMCIINNK